MMKKEGFTLAETLLCLAIIGIISASALIIVKPQDKAIRYIYSNLFHSLDRAYYNVTADGNDYFIGDSGAGAKLLCETLVEYINAETVNCSSSNLTSPKADDFPDKNIQFISTNGMRFYISDRLGDENSVEFYLVFVDTNGEKKPNSALYVSESDDAKAPKAQDPDIFAFALLPSGRVMPVGAPEFDRKYMLTRVVYYDDDLETVYTKFSQPYYASKSEAWGFYSDKNIKVEEICNTGEVYSCNDLVREIIGSDSVLLENFEIPMDNLPPVNTEEYKCAPEDYDSCSLVVDKYVK